MDTTFKPDSMISVTLTKTPTRAAAAKTLERLFMKCKKFAAPVVARNANFKAIPKRRGGRIWTKYPNKAHAKMDKGSVAKIQATPSHLRDLESVSEFVEIKAA